MMRRASLTLGWWIVVVFLSRGLAGDSALAGDEIRINAEQGLPECTHASLQDGSCATPQLGQLAALTDAQASATGDRCDAAAKGEGTLYVLCRYDGASWREFGASPVASAFTTASASGGVASAGAALILDILNPPIESGLTPPVGDGIDGQPNAPRTDDAPAITAAIQYACDNGYDVAYLGPGTYRIGEADTETSFYTGIIIDAKLCPNGIKFHGAGIGQTVLLVNGDEGQYLIVVTDEFFDNTKVHRIGWNSFGHFGDRTVTGFTTGVTPPVITGSSNSFLADGDTVFIRNCSGVTQANENRFKVNNCTGGPPYTCELQDEFGIDIDATSWDPWTADTPCIVHKMNTNFVTEIAYMTLRDDDINEHMKIVCNPLCWIPGEESHGIGILQGGGVTEVHDVLFDRFGDEAIDISAPESPTYIHDVTILNAVHGGMPIYQGVGIRIADVWVHKNQDSPWDKTDIGSTEFIPYVAGNAFEINPGTKNWRVLDTQITRVVATGLLGSGFGIDTAPSGLSGQYISGVKVTNSIINLNPQAMHCDDNPEYCGSFKVASDSFSFPIENIEVSDNYMTGTAGLFVAEGNGGVIVRNNTIVPIPGLAPKWGIVAGAKETLIEGNSVSGFRRGCILYRPYEIIEEVSSTITTTIRGNTLSCESNIAALDPIIGQSSGDIPPQDLLADAYFRIYDNVITASVSDFVRRGIVINDDWKGLEICRNTITLGTTMSSAYGIWGKSSGQLICDNVISVAGVGIRAEADGSKVVGNEIHGFDTENAQGILVFDSSDVLVLRNTISGYETETSTGIRIDAGNAPQSQFLIVGNEMGGGRFGINVDGGGLGLSDVTVSDNKVEMNGVAGSDGILLYNVNNALIAGNELRGFTGANAKALLTAGGTDFVTVRDNLAQGGGTLKFGSTQENGDETCNHQGASGFNSTCENNVILP